ncbi:Nucleotide-diphospho-sugar transferase domain-containing protein [Caenorhabditis elegans]|uniref:Nucleotide-diphospho-sugar transferase domain-containing protein n=1 Tax=Caenorhabditis elegans TaxID=6239 RepID=P91872_CAEEL|nr:Nucleotide-diphospho-sugar transferase domain-containing protein [Caenorhabditis elegans]CAB04245.3 Nucleotide-diphospho-sugar transferase domain-containing protein [Caenorhabditis elegans]|eukprot:NP_492418.3 Uncharacterized protein CELE_F32H2.8 [Caenorhabditis elegans]
MIIKTNKVLKNAVLRKVPYFILFLIVIFSFIATYYPLTMHNEHDEEENLEYFDQFSMKRNVHNEKRDITVLIIVNNLGRAESEYSISLNTVRCYCQKHNYRLEIVEDTEFRNFCQQENSMYRRHCIVGHLLRNNDFIFLLDPGMTILNTEIRLEQFTDEKYALTMFDKFSNWEIETNSYVVKNTYWSRNFLMKLADFESKLPFSSTDNVAIHILIQKDFYPQFTEEAGTCLKILENLEFSTSNSAIMYTFEACIRAVIGENHEFKNLRILKKGTGWARDIWLTESKWSQQRDFMLSGLKYSLKTEISNGILSNIFLGKESWKSPFLKTPFLGECDEKDWIHDQSLITTKTEIERYLVEKFKEVEKMRWRSLAAAGNYLSKQS